VGERDQYGVGFSDNVIFRKQYYLRAVLEDPLLLYRHEDERFMARGYAPSDNDLMPRTASGWSFVVTGTGFEATLEVELDYVPLDGAPVPLLEHLAIAPTATPEKSAMPKPAGETGPPGA
jgi:hypothetical protein